MADQTLSDWYNSVCRNAAADYYQMAGVARFESDSEVIRASATQRAKFVNTVVRKAKGDEVADRLIKKLQAVAKCLCNDERRAEYDQKTFGEQKEQALPGPPAHKAPAPQAPRTPAPYREEDVTSPQPVVPAPAEDVPVASDGMPQIVTVDPVRGSKRRKQRKEKRQAGTSNPRGKVLIGVGLVVVVLVAAVGMYFSGDGQASTGSRDVPAATRADRAFCYLVLREDLPRQLDLSDTQKMQHALATQIMSGKLNYIVGGIPNAELLPIDTEALMNRVDRRREKLDELGASLKRMLTTTQKAKFWVLHASLGLASIEMKKDGKQFSVHFSSETPLSSGERYESLDTQAAWSHLDSYSDVLELVERSRATTQELERNTINSALSWLMQPYGGKETQASRDELADALWSLYKDPASEIDQKHIALGMARVGCGSKHIDDWLKAVEQHRLRDEHIVGGLCHFDLPAAGKFILDAARKDEIHNACVEALLTAGQPAVEVIVEANAITNGRHYGRFTEFVERRGLDASKIVSRQDMMNDPVKGKEIEERIAAQQAEANVENYLRTLESLANLEDPYAPPRAAFSLISDFEKFAPLLEEHGSPAPLLVTYIETDPNADSLGRAVQALSYYAADGHVPTFVGVMDRPDDFHLARAWAAASLAILSPKDFQAATKNGFKSHREIAHFREACVELNKASVVVLASLLETDSLEQAIQVSQIITTLNQPESNEVLSSASAHPSWSEFDTNHFRSIIEQRLKDLTDK